MRGNQQQKGMPPVSRIMYFNVIKSCKGSNILCLLFIVMEDEPSRVLILDWSDMLLFILIILSLIKLYKITTRTANKNQIKPANKKE